MKTILMFVLALMLISFSSCSKTEEEIKDDARSASVQTVFHIPVIKASFTTPLPKDEEVTKESLEEVLEKLREDLKEETKEKIKKEIELLQEDRFENYPTIIERYGILPPSPTMIPIGIMLGHEEEVKFLDRIIVVCEVEKTDIREWEKEYEKDVLSISEVANVSSSTAKDIISRLRREGYSVSKEEVAKSPHVKLLWYRHGWDGSYEILNWEIKIEGTKESIIVGYSNGVIETRPIPEDKRVYVKAQYFTLKPKFKKKSDDLKDAERKLDEKDKEIKRLEKLIKEKEKELQKDEKKKRNIADATMYDVIHGRVKLESLWYSTAASGIYIGDTKIRNNFEGWSWPRGWFLFGEQTFLEKASCVLTNAHVANISADLTLYVSEDTEIMWIQYPGIPFIRYTDSSDYFGTPASVLYINQEPVSSAGFDSAIMVTTPVESMKNNRAIFGNSDNVKAGDRVVMVGNPALLQKFTTVGTVSNTSYNMMDGFLYQFLSKHLEKSPVLYTFLKSSRFWFDTPIGTGGTSGSGVWALEGSEKGKVVAIHNIGLVNNSSFIMVEDELKEIQKDKINIKSGLVSDVIKNNMGMFVDKEEYKKVKYSVTYDKFIKKEKTFEGIVEKSGGRVEIPGLNGGIPINLIKQYLEEMGLSPKEFGWDSLPKEYFAR